LRRLRVLHIARNFPSSALPRVGLWTERLVRATLPHCESEVIAPVPYWPPLPGPRIFTQYRRVTYQRSDAGLRIHHPRILVGPAFLLHSFEGSPFYHGVRRTADRLNRAQRFDLVHAHFVYPDGWAAARLARRWRVPLIVTEHASWNPWLTRHPRVRRRAIEVARQARWMIAVSRALRDNMAEFIGITDQLVVIPNAVDETVFVPKGGRPGSPRIVFVGLVRRVKGLDVLVRALRLLRDRGFVLKLAVIGESPFRGYQRDQAAARELVDALGLSSQVEFLGGLPPEQVADEIRQSSALVLPSRRETFGSVLVEALACGVPVVATRCGGTEDIVVSGELGELVEPENPRALADGIATVLANQARYDPARLRAYAVAHFGMKAVGDRLASIYRQAVATPGGA
jgi:glycosyltransferase involved in cell wall biosynthesis